MERKGQAAMEFLMTYGWAILAAVIAIGVLSYFGVFSPGKYVGSSAVVTSPFYATAWNVQTNQVQLELRNNGDGDLTLQNVSISGCGSNITAGVIGASKLSAIVVPCGSALTAGDSFKGDIVISYLKSGSTVSLKSSGTIADKVTA